MKPRPMWRSFLFCALLLLSVLNGGRLSAQSEPKEAALGPDDVIEITVRNHSDLNRTVTIPANGKITLPEVGEIQAAGKTPKALAADIFTELDKTLNNVVVFVSLKETHSLRLRVLGGLKTVGAFDLKPNWKLLDLVAAGGGFSVKPAQVSGRIIRGKSQVIALDVAQAVARPDSPANVALEPDDLILFDEIEPVHHQIHVMGQIAKQGAYELDNSTTLLTLLSQAGGTTPRAALSRAYVLRDGKEMPLNLRPLVIEGKSDPSVIHFKFQPGDILFLPENEARYSVMGEAKAPGYYPLPENGHVAVLEAFTLAGGQGDAAKAGIIRVVGGKPTVIPVNIDEMLKKGRLASNVNLQAEDILYIPAKGARKFGWQDLLTPLSALSLLGFRFGR